MIARGGFTGWARSAADADGLGSAPSPARVAPPAWYDVTWNPTAGCSPAGSGCEHCSALRTVAQLARIGGKSGARYAGLTAATRAGPRWTGELRVRPDVLTWPLFQRRRRRILVDSLSEPFHEALAREAIDDIHAVIALAQRHRFIVLTRRATEMRAYYSEPETPLRVAAAAERLAAAVRPGRGLPPLLSGAAAAFAGWPLANLWLGVAVEDQSHTRRIAELLDTPARLRWACFEPLIDAVRPDLIALGGDRYLDALGGARFALDGRGRRTPAGPAALSSLDWVMAGGEAGPGARPADPDWVRDLRDRCIAAGVPFYFKQWGEWAPAPAGASGPKVVRRGRRAAGRLIDGRSWDELPAPRRERGRRLR